jgi:hypothetical protein
MAAYSEAKSKHYALTASQVDTVTLTGQVNFVEVIHHGNVSNPIYVLIGAAALVPTVAGDDTEVVLAGERVRFGVGRTADPAISVICAGAATVSIVGVL